MGSNTLRTARARRRAVAVAAVMLVSSLVALRPGVAQETADGPDCLPAGGVDRPFEPTADFDTAPYDLIVNGGGFGHGVGMSQYGARGAALAGCTYPTILETYYPGAHVGALEAARESIALHLRRIGLDPTSIRTTGADAGGRPIDWVACEEDGVTCQTIDASPQPAGSTWVVHPGADGTFTLADPGVPADCDVATAGCHWRGGTIQTRLRMLHDDTVVRVLEVDTTCRGTAGLCTKWGWIEFDYTSATATGFPSGQTYVTQYVSGDGADLTAMDRYLWGLEEVPASWPEHALRAQAVAGRSYAEATIQQRESAYGRHPVAGYVDRTDQKCRCDLFRTTLDQHWTGWDREYRDSEGRWVAAVTGSAGEHVLYDRGEDGIEVVTAFYSSSHGGFSENVEHIWGTAYPYLKAVDNSRWECLSDNPLQRWTRGFTRDTLATEFGLATVEDAQVVYRGPGGRPTVLDVDGDGKRPDGIVVTGTDAEGGAVTKRYSSESIRSVLGLRSGLVHFEWIDQEPEPSPSPSPSPSPTTSRAEQDTSCTISPEPDRVSGEGRIGTAVAASVYGWDTSGTVVIARADHPADALAGSGLAGSLDAPLLITPTDVLDTAVRDEVNRLGATRAILLGGEAALGPAVEQGLLDDTSVEDVQRAMGPTRMHTAVAVADRLTIPADGTALLVRGQNAAHPEREWPDALSVAAIAAHKAKAGAAWPILLTGETLPDVTLEALERYGIRKVYAIGGSAVVPDEIVAELTQRGYEVERIAGTDRWGTSREALGFAVGDQQVLVAATGLNFPDGLAAGPLAARLGGRLLLVPRTYDATQSPWLADEHPAAVSALGWDAGQVVIVGGEGAVETSVGRALRNSM